MKAIRICRFDSAEHLTGKKRTYDAVKQAVLASGKFSCFEASANTKKANLFTMLCRDSELEITPLGFPWTGVKLRRATPDTKGKQP